MKKLLLCLVFGFLMVGCSSNATPEATPEVTPEATPEVSEDVDLTFSIIAPTGAPSLALLGMYEDYGSEYNFVAGSDPLQAAFVNPTPEYDFIIAPTNLGVKLATTGATTYELAGIVTWGNLYIVGISSDDLQNPDKKLAVFGETAVPGLVFEAIKENLNIQAEIEYFSSTSEAQAALLAGTVDAALIAEPLVSATLVKGAEIEKEFVVISDIQEEWTTTHEGERVGYPQAALFVNPSIMEERGTDVEAFLSELASSIETLNQPESKEEIATMIDSIGADVFGVPASPISSTAYPKMGLNYIPAADAVGDIQSFLEIFNIEFSEEILVK